MINSINPGIPLTDLKMRKCRDCNNQIVFTYGAKMKMIPIYCNECHDRRVIYDY